MPASIDENIVILLTFTLGIGVEKISKTLWNTSVNGESVTGKSVIWLALNTDGFTQKE